MINFSFAFSWIMFYLFPKQLNLSNNVIFQTNCYPYKILKNLYKMIY